MPLPRTELEEPTELTDFSASRLGTGMRCGLAFEYKYVKQLPAPYDRATTLFGHAVHDGVHEWYGMDDKPNDHTERDLAPIILSQWERLLPPEIWKRVVELRDLDEECAAVAAAVQFKRPTLKNPAQTKEYMESEVVKQFTEKRQAMVDICDKLEEVKWPKTEDPYAAYKLTAKIGEQMQARWQHLPRPLIVERPFAIEFEGFRLRGRIDQVRIDPPRDKRRKQLGRMLDIKTIQQPMTPMEAFLQSFIYTLGADEFDDIPDTGGEVAFYLARKDVYQQGRVDRKRHARIASRILNGVANKIVLGQFEPSYGFWCKRCDFEDICSTEISLWSGDGIVVDLLDVAT